MKRILLSASLFALSAAAHAVDGVILIDQAKALAGGVTPGDVAGFPVTISKPGSYRLSSNLTLPDTNTDGIVSTAGGVTLDLNGFSIIGPAYCPGQNGGPEYACNLGNGNAVRFTDPGNSLSSAGVSYVVRNGRIFGAGGNGILVENGLVENMDIGFVGGAGIDMRSRTGIARNNQVRGSQLSGIVSYVVGGLIENNVVETNNSPVSGKNAIVRNNRLTTTSTWAAALNCSGPMSYSGNFLAFTQAGGKTISGSGCYDGGANLVLQVQ